MPILIRETKYLKLMQNNIEKTKNSNYWSRYKRSSAYHVIESIKVISLKKSIVISLPSCKVDYKNKIKKLFRKITAQLHSQIK